MLGFIGLYSDRLRHHMKCPNKILSTIQKRLLLIKFILMWWISRDDKPFIIFNNCFVFLTFNDYVCASSSSPPAFFNSIDWNQFNETIATIESLLMMNEKRTIYIKRAWKCLSIKCSKTKFSVYFYVYSSTGNL